MCSLWMYVMFVNSMDKYWQRDATRWKEREADGCRWKHVVFQSFLCIFLPVHKIEDVDPLNLEPQSFVKLRKRKVTYAKATWVSGQLSMSEGWGPWFYRRPTNPLNQKKALRECPGGSDSMENDACKQPQRQQFCRDHHVENTLVRLIL